MTVATESEPGMSVLDSQDHAGKNHPTHHTAFSTTHTIWICENEK